MTTKPKTDKITLDVIFNSLTKAEQELLSLGLFPVKLQPLNLSNGEAAELIRISQKITKVIY